MHKNILWGGRVVMSSVVTMMVLTVKKIMMVDGVLNILFFIFSSFPTEFLTIVSDLLK